MNAFHLHVSLETVIFSVTVEELKKKKKLKIFLHSYRPENKFIPVRVRAIPQTNRGQHTTLLRPENRIHLISSLSLDIRMSPICV